MKIIISLLLVLLMIITASCVKNRQESNIIGKATKTSSNIYYVSTEGSDETGDGPYDPWIMGSNIAPGWTLLGGFDAELEMILENGDISSVTNKERTNKMAFYASLAHNKMVGVCQKSNQGRETCDSIDNDCDGWTDENIDCTVSQPQNGGSGGGSGGGGVNSGEENSEQSQNSQTTTTLPQGAESDEAQNDNNELVIPNNNRNIPDTDNDEAGVAEEQPKGSTILSRFMTIGNSLILATIIFVLTITGFVVRHHFSLKTLPQELIKQQTNAQQTQNNLNNGQNTNNLNFTSFDNYIKEMYDPEQSRALVYIDQMLARGRNELEIGEVLIADQWSQDQVNQYIKAYHTLRSDFDVLRFLTSIKHLGRPKEYALSLLVSKGWKKDQALEKVESFWEGIR